MDEETDSCDDGFGRNSYMDIFSFARVNSYTKYICTPPLRKNVYVALRCVGACDVLVIYNWLCMCAHTFTPAYGHAQTHTISQCGNGENVFVETMLQSAAISWICFEQSVRSRYTDLITNTHTHSSIVT